MKIVITRHAGLVEYLEEAGIIPAGTPVIGQASIEDVKGKHVIGVLPNFLAVHAASITEIPLDIPAELRGRELSVEQVRAYAGTPVTYVILTKSEYDKLADDAFVGEMTRGC